MGDFWWLNPVIFLHVHGFQVFYLWKLVGGLEHLLFLHILGMPSSQLTTVYFFLRG